MIRHVATSSERPSSVEKLYEGSPSRPLAPNLRQLRTFWLGRLGYDDAHALQVEVRDAVIAGTAPATLLLLEHDPVVTVGRRGPLGDLCASPESLAKRGIALRATERGGRATYHGPGQLVAYLIARVRELAADIPGYVWGLEEAMVRAVAPFGIIAHRHPEHRGVWVGEAKLASVGIAVSRGVCWHGCALNVDPDLDAFCLIRACGLDAEATSIARCAGAAPPLETMAELVATELSRVFGLRGTLPSDGAPLAPVVMGRSRPQG